jgi:hypothetical protein
LPAESNDVVAVYVTAQWSHSGTAPTSSEEHTLRPVPADEGEIPGRFHPYLSRGYYLWLVAIADSTRRGEYTMTKLYRRGFQTVVVVPDNTNPEVIRKPATTPDEQEQAVRDLLYRVAEGQSINYIRNSAESTLAPGSRDPGHRKILLFAAEEFEIIAKLYPERGPSCLAEAARLRHRASE